MFGQWWKAILDLIYPPKCPVCRRSVNAHGEWCSRCLADVLAVREINLLEHHLRYLDSCRAVCEYNAGVKRLIHDMKYRGAGKHAVYLNWLLDKVQVAARLASIDIAVPVPLHADRLIERGYNQTELIFKPWAERCRITWQNHCLVRTRSTVPQWELTLAERRANIKGAFQATRPEYIYGKHILLVDDIFTTGTTMEECAKVLKKAGAQSVHGLALASGAG